MEVFGTGAGTFRPLGQEWYGTRLTKGAGTAAGCRFGNSGGQRGQNMRNGRLRGQPQAPRRKPPGPTDVDILSGTSARFINKPLVYELGLRVPSRSGQTWAQSGQTCPPKRGAPSPATYSGPNEAECCKVYGKWGLSGLRRPLYSGRCN